MTAPTAIQFQRSFALEPAQRELILARHGSIPWDPHRPESKAAAGQDPPLSDEGVTQATKLCERLAKEPIAHVAVTPLQRTRQTAAPLLEATGIEPVVVPELREVRLGTWEGQLARRLREGGEIAQRVFAEERWDPIPGAETADAFATRVRRGLEQVLDAVDDGEVAVAVVHAGVIAEACRQVTNSDGFAFLRAENGSITRIVRDGDGSWWLRCFNDTSHLWSAPSGRRGR